MKLVKQEVKSASAVVAIVETPEFDNLSEAVQTLGEDECRKLINTQHATNLKNAARAAATQGPSKAQVQAEAMQRIVTVPELLAELQGSAGNPGKTKELIDRVSKEIEAEYDEKRKALVAQVQPVAEEAAA